MRPPVADRPPWANTRYALLVHLEQGSEQLPQELWTNLREVGKFHFHYRGQLVCFGGRKIFGRWYDTVTVGTEIRWMRKAGIWPTVYPIRNSWGKMYPTS